MPSERSPEMLTFSGEVSFHVSISASFSSNRRCAGRALAGIITLPRMSRTYRGGAGSGAGPRGRTIVFEWHTRVVSRNSTGRPQRSEISTASKRKS